MTQTFVEAARLYEAALDAWNAANYREAISLLREAITLAPEVPAYHANLGVMLRGQVEPGERIECYRRAIELDPGNATYFANLAAALNAAGRHLEAEESARRAFALAPERHETLHNLASALAGQRRWHEAALTYDQALALAGDSPRTTMAAATAYAECGDHEQAVVRFKRVLDHPQSSPDQRINCWHGLGKALTALGRGKEAVECFRHALSVKPDHLHLLIDLGNLLKRLTNFEEARQCYIRVLGKDPGCVEAIFNLGAVEQACGCHSEALRLYREAIAIDPSIPAIWNNMAACLTYSTDVPPAVVRKELDRFDSAITRGLHQNLRFSQTKDPDRPLRVGYVSADFRAHPVGYLALPLIEGHRRDRIHVTCYFSHHQTDEWTNKFKLAADAWVEVGRLDDAALAERIRSDAIDVLVDLAGHTEGNRLLAFARKPAPVQVTWMGYVTTTGMSAMDWRITHADADPPGSESGYSEKLWRLQGAMWCFRPLPGMLDVGAAPFIKHGCITFGSFNRFSKTSPETLAAWAKILHRVPDSRLLLCATPGEMAGKLGEYFASRGVSPERIKTFASVSHQRFWELHGEVDLALDPFPFNGGMTSCESLWLGVPLVTCTGVSTAEYENCFPARFASRMGYAFLNNIGLPELAAEDISQYVDIAASLARDPQRLITLRATLRRRMEESALLDEARFVNEIEAAYRTMWRAYCETNA